MSMYRNTVWFFKGMKEYTKNGYNAASKSFNASDLDVDCSARSYMITGANSGVGKACATAIAKKGGTIHMVCRSKDRGMEALEEIKQSSGNENIFLHLLDMSSPRKVIDFAQEFVKSDKPLHVLVNNAGCMVNEREVDEDGLEKNFATNTLGTHLLTVNLIPALMKQTDPRVVTVSSGGMLPSKLDTKDLSFANMKPFDGTFAYSQNKRQQIVMTAKYAEQYSSIHFSAMHPGWADTPAVRSSMPGFYEKMKNRLRTPEEGADTMIWLAICPRVPEQPSGLFFQDRKSVPVHLPLAWTKSKKEEEDQFMNILEEYNKKFQSSN